MIKNEGGRCRLECTDCHGCEMFCDRRDVVSLSSVSYKKAIDCPTIRPNTVMSSDDLNVYDVESVLIKKGINVKFTSEVLHKMYIEMNV